jgi:hypothetical protein
MTGESERSGVCSRLCLRADERVPVRWRLAARAASAFRLASARCSSGDAGGRADATDENSESISAGADGPLGGLVGAI